MTSLTEADSGLPRLRNIGILAHIDAGKTSVTERILHVAGVRPIAGDVDDGTTATDYLEIERRRGITIKAAAVSFLWRECTIRLIDTPGHVDFGAEVDRSISALDGAVLLLCGVSGVQSRTEVLVDACERASLPRIVFVNKMDRRGSDFLAALDELRTGIASSAVAVQLPYGEGESLTGIIDLVTLQFYPFPPAGLAQPVQPIPLSSSQIPEEYRERALNLRITLLESLAEHDTSIMEDFLESKEIQATRIRSALRSATLSRSLIPVLCGTAFNDVSAELLLDAVIDYLPSPSDSGPRIGLKPGSSILVTRAPEPTAPSSSLVFKTSVHPEMGILAWTRVWSGTLIPEMRLLDARSGATVRIKSIFTMQVQDFRELDHAGPGDIVALSIQGGTEDAWTGATLCDPRNPVVFESPEIPEPVVSVAVEARNGKDSTRVAKALAALATEDSSLRVGQDVRTGRFELSGQGELHLEVALERLSRDYGVSIRSGMPTVAYRESIAGTVVHREDFDREIGGEQVRCSIELRAESADRGKGVTRIIGPDIRMPAAFVECILRGVDSALTAGPLFGFPMEDTQISVTAYIPPSSQGKLGLVALEAAASLCARASLQDAKPILLEPWMRLDLEVPDEHFGAAAALVTSRGGRIESVDAAADGKVVLAKAPMRRLFGFSTDLRSSSEGKGRFQARFYRYEPAPTGFSPT